MGNSGGSRGAPTPALTMRTGAPAAVTLLVAVPQDVTFTWSSPFSSASYSHDVGLGAPLLGKVSVAVKTKTASALTVTLTASSLVAAGATVSAIAWM